MRRHRELAKATAAAHSYQAVPGGDTTATSQEAMLSLAHFPSKQRSCLRPARRSAVRIAQCHGQHGQAGAGLLPRQLCEWPQHAPPVGARCLALRTQPVHTDFITESALCMALYAKHTLPVGARCLALRQITPVTYVTHINHCVALWPSSQPTQPI